MRNRLRILLVAEPGIDGVFHHVDGLARYLLDQGYEVHLAYSDKRGSPELLKLIDLVIAKGGRCLNLKVVNAPDWRDLPALIRLFRFVKMTKPAIIHGHSSKAGVLSRALYFLGVRAHFFYTPHAYYGLSFRSELTTDFYNWVEYFLSGIGTTINISPDEQRFAVNELKIPASRCVAIHNPVDTVKFIPATDAEKLEQRRKLGIPENAIVMGSMGRLSFQKDPATLYEAFARAREKGFDIYLLHVGQGEQSEEIERLAKSLRIEDRLIRFSYFRNPIEFYSAIDAFMITSRYEAGWPLVILEAMACNLPIISGTGPGSSDLPHAGLSHCWTASTGDVDGFRQCIEDWFADRPKIRPCNHRAIVTERFKPENCFGAVLAVYLSKSETLAR